MDKNYRHEVLNLHDISLSISKMYKLK
ncbi:hypothetical protein SCA6_002677, partial [Theobroma cacao]